MEGGGKTWIHSTFTSMYRCSYFLSSLTLPGTCCCPILPIVRGTVFLNSLARYRLMDETGCSSHLGCLFLSFLFFPRGCFVPKPSLWPLHPHYFFFCSRHPSLLFPTGELMDTENKKPNCDSKINDDSLLVLPFTGLVTRSSSSIFDVFVITKHRWGPAASMLCSRFKGRTFGTKWKKKKSKNRSWEGQRQHMGSRVESLDLLALVSSSAKWTKAILHREVVKLSKWNIDYLEQFLA